MINMLLIPFMCLSLSEGTNEAESRTKTFNEITSISDAGYKDDAAYKGALRAARASSNYVETTHQEGSQEHPSMGAAEKLEFIDVSNNKSLYSYMTVNGSTQSLNKRDVYSFFIKDRMTIHCKFLQWGRSMTGYVVSEKGEKLFEFTDDDEEYGPTVLLKKGIYFLYIDNEDSAKTDYSLTIGIHYAESGEKVTIDADFMKKYKALVWESDYVPGDADPVDGTMLKSGSKTRRGSWKYTGGFYSCNVNEQFLYRSIYIWTEEAFDALQEDVEKYKAAALDAISKSNRVVTSLSWASTVSGGVGLVVSFVPVVGGTLGAAISSISLADSLAAMSIGNGTELNKELITRQCERILGSLDAAIDGTVISIKESAYIKEYETGDKYIKKRSYKLKFAPYVNQLDDTHCVVDRKASKPYPTYDAWLHFGGDKEVVSDCQGTFTAYKDFRDIKPLISEETLS